MRQSIFKLMIKNGHIGPIKEAYEKDQLTGSQRVYVKELLMHVGELKRKNADTLPATILMLIIGVMFVVFLSLLVGCEKVIERIEVQNEPCSVEQNSLGALITCPNKPSVQVFNGSDGVDGTSFDPVVLTALYSLLQQLEERVGNLEDAPQTQFVKLCPNSTEYGIRQGTNLYAVGFTSENGGGLMLLTPNKKYLTTTNLTNACKFKVEADGTTSGHSYGHNISSQFQQQPNQPVVPAETCSVVNQNQTDNSYLVTTSGTILNSSGTLSITGNISGHNYNGGGASVSSNGASGLLNRMLV